jgi:iron complex outermembrane recepter protein
LTKNISHWNSTPLVAVADITNRTQDLSEYLYLDDRQTKGSRITANIGYQRSIRREFSHPVLSDIPGLYLQLNSYSYDIKYYSAEIDNWAVTAGVNGMYQHNNVSQGTEFVIPSYTQFDVGPFLLAKKTMGKIDIAGGLRYNIRSFKNSQLYATSNAIRL